VEGQVSLEKETWLKGEPSFEDLIADPIVHLVMRRDSLTAEDIWAVTYRARSALRTHAEACGERLPPDHRKREQGIHRFMNSQAISQTIARHTKTKGALPQSILRTVLEPLRRFRTWRDRRLAARDLERLDDRLLADIGLDRGQIRFVIDGFGRRAEASQTRSRQAAKPSPVSTDISRMTTRGHR
jgi:uncharacterized protein YjiS (DUF1127 family)